MRRWQRNFQTTVSRKRRAAIEAIKTRRNLATDWNSVRRKRRAAIEAIKTPPDTICRLPVRFRRKRCAAIEAMKVLVGLPGAAIRAALVDQHRTEGRA